jgi:hypothetical protein
MLRISRWIRLAGAIGAATLLGQGCGTVPIRPAPVPLSPSCTVPTTLAAPPESISVALASKAMVERFASAQVHETLVRVDCEGRIHPGLARSWTSDDMGHRWTVVLRDDAHFENGDPLTTRDVVAAWRATADLPAPHGDLPRWLADAATILDDRTLLLSLPDTQPLVLADRSLAIHRPRPGSRAAEGTGPYRIQGDPTTAGEMIELLAVVPGTGPRVLVRAVDGGDGRDLVDATVDLLVTADPKVVSYAAARADLVSMPLPWSRTHLLISPRAREADSVRFDVRAFRQALARDAVRAEARAAEPPFWWGDIGQCETRSGERLVTPAPARTTRLVYRRDDHVARELAERIVALAAIEGTSGAGAGLAALAPELQSVGTRATAVGLAPADFATALGKGDELAYVLELPTRPIAPCDEADALIASAPWIAASGVSLVPLIDTRDRAIARRDGISLSIDWDGTLHLVGAAPLAGPRSP